MPKALMLVASRPTDSDRIDEFNTWYEEHVQELLGLDGITSATRWEASAHQMIPGMDGIDGRRFLALYEIECDDVKAVRNEINSSSPNRSHSDLLEMDPLPITVLFEHLGEWKSE
jgi:hypothetical protein